MKLLKITKIAIAMLSVATFITGCSKSEDETINSTGLTKVEKNVVKKSNNLTARYGSVKTISSSNRIPKGWVVIHEDGILHKYVIKDLKGAPTGTIEEILYSYSYPPKGWVVIRKDDILRKYIIKNIKGSPSGTIEEILYSYSYPPKGWVIIRKDDIARKYIIKKL